MNGSSLSTSRPPADGKAPERSRPALARLREQVHHAADTIEQLRAENRTLRRRVAELEARPTVGDGEIVLRVDDPDAMRRQIEGFIETIDTYLEERDPPDASDGASD